MKKKVWKIYKFSDKGDELIQLGKSKEYSTDVASEAEAYLRKKQEDGCSFIVSPEAPVEVPEKLVTEINEALEYGVIQIMWPMAGGMGG